jgi:hypothetical protein
MAQNPLQVDVLQIEPGSGDTITISRDANGNISFVDAVVTGGVTLSALAGLGTVTEVLVVGKAGAGATYTTVQAALDAVPGASSSKAAPYAILVLPGTYAENVTIEKDGVTLLGFGRPTIAPAAGNAIEVVAAVSTIPKDVELRGLALEVADVASSCVLVTGGAGSEVASGELVIADCDMTAAAGGFALKAASVNNLRAEGGDWISGIEVRCVDCASVRLSGQVALPAVQLDYDTGGTIPSVAGSAYAVSGAGSTGNILSTLNSAGSLVISGCPSVGDVTMGGDRTLSVTGSQLGDITLNNTAAASLVGSSRGTAAGAGTLAEPILVGSAAFAAAASATIAFDVDQPDAVFTVSLEAPVAGDIPTVSSRAVGGFDIDFAGVQTTTVYWTVSRRM